MVLVRRIRKRGANIVVEANAEVLFAATGDVGRWTNRFSQRVRTFAAEAAPINKRPRWGHYGKPLKTTFTASTTYQPGRMKVYSAIGSTSPHAYYVDQGTGVYNGSGPYEAKVLPPWTRGDPSLYESTWHPPGQQADHTVVIKGQKGQGFFDAGLKRGFAAMRMRAYQVPGDPRIGKALASFPEGLANFAGNTPGGSAFRASLTEWRAWRDRAFNSGRLLGRDGGYRSNFYEKRRAERMARGSRRYTPRTAEAQARRAEESRKRSQRWRDAKAKKLNKPKKRQTLFQQAQLSAKREMAGFLLRNPGFKIISYDAYGFKYRDRGGAIRSRFWGIGTADLFADAGIKR